MIPNRVGEKGKDYASKCNLMNSLGCLRTSLLNVTKIIHEHKNEIYVCKERML